MVFRHRLLALSVALVTAIYGAPAFSQGSEGRITGVVTDPTGASIPGATVTITAQTGGVTKVVTSGADGRYSASVASGVYSVSVALKGFGRQTQKDLKLEAGATQSVNFGLAAQLSEEVTVTSLKRESTLQEVPFSVAAPTEGELQKRGVDDIEGVARNVAGFSVQNLGPGQSQVAIRGVSSGQIARDQPGVKEQVGAYLDESVISLSLFTPDMDLFDMNRVEVLRGPQGTLFGSGSETGTVRYISNQPELGGKAKAFGEVGGNTIDGGNQGGNVKLGVNAPLGDKAALRVAGFYTRFAGYMDTPGAQRTATGAIRPDTGNPTQDVNTGDRTGVRAAIKIAPNDRLTITPRIVYQEVKTDGWNRIDAYNIMANPFTTTRPPVTLGEREQFTQIREPFKDKFLLGDLNIGYRFGTVTLTSITSYTDRDVDVVRDATALTGGYTSLIWGVPENVYTLDAPLDDATHAKLFTQEIRFSGGKDRVQWVAGGFYANTKRNYGQNLFVDGFTEMTGITSAGQYAPNDVLFYSDLRYKLDQYAVFGEGTYSFGDKFSLTGGLRYYHFKEDRTQVFDGLFADPASKPGTITADGVAPRLIATYKVSDTTNLNAQVSKGFRLGGINDQLNKPLCSPADLATFGGHDTWNDETSWNYEIGSKSRIMGGRGSFSVSAFYLDVNDLQATLTAGTCSSRVVFSVPKSRSTGAEAEFAVTPSKNFDFALSASYNDAKLKSTVTSTAADGSVSVVGAIQDGNRLPSVPEFQMAAAATYQWQMKGSLGYVTGTYQHVGSRYTQVQDQEPGFGVINVGFGGIGKPYTQATFQFDPELPAYDLVNLRLGVLKGNWDVALFGNNLTDERALLAIDREAGKSARLGYLTNQPRTFGLVARVKF